MINCPKCGEAVKEEKAFCPKCGSPMDAAKANRKPMPDFGATIIQPPKRTASPPDITPSAPPIASPALPVATPAAPPPPVIATPASMPMAQFTGGNSASVSHSSTHVSLPAQSPERRNSARKIGFGFILLLLFLMFIAFVVALWLD